MSNFLPGIMDGFVLASHIAACAEETITYNNTPIFLIGCYRLFSICKHPTGDSGIHPNSTMVVHEGQFSEAVEDDVEVMLEEVYEHLNTGTLPDGLADMNGGLQLMLTMQNPLENSLWQLGLKLVVVSWDGPLDSTQNITYFAHFAHCGNFP
ncbi:uncharacterized protein EI90DRAFT_3292543 [Cantharellus anzutake]|uniref:uncharacterized protein n=1 Tax=Cantharellus anzutake TaxID=1750568 RepID=UPI0019040283|nr:uncharacterized protein EI90DRAFT_3292543 [Cantharellus anzutake]KAF8322316.1 hypothetical protein EI90DRAFT_3292543 [Cantharellus anzutake]